MYLGSDAANFAVLLARVWVAIMIFAHGWRHVKAIRSGPGMANWFESLGLKPGPLPRVDGHRHRGRRSRSLLVLGFLTPLAYGGVCALMLVALLTNHLKNGFFLSSAKEGYEYVAHRRGAVDHARHARPGQVVARPRLRLRRSRSIPKKALLITAIVGIGGAAAFLARVLASAEEGPGRAAEP